MKCLASRLVSITAAQPNWREPLRFVLAFFPPSPLRIPKKLCWICTRLGGYKNQSLLMALIHEKALASFFSLSLFFPTVERGIFTRGHCNSSFRFREWLNIGWNLKPYETRWYISLGRYFDSFFFKLFTKSSLSCYYQHYPSKVKSEDLINKAQLL